MSSLTLALLLAAGSAIGCGGSGTAPPPDLGLPGDGALPSDLGASDGDAADAAPQADGPFMTAAHGMFPQVPDHGGHVLTSPQLITVTFAGYEYEQEMQAYGDFIVASQWLTTVGADYGVGAGAHLAKVVLQDPLPTTAVSDSDVAGFLLQKVAQGTLPAPPDRASNYVYVIYYPRTVTLLLQGQKSCQAFAGFHDEASNEMFQLAYVALPTCTTQFSSLSDAQSTQVSMSHEFIEAATNAYPESAPAFIINDPNSAWNFVPGEVADLCVRKGWREGTHYAQRVWSNTAAAAGKDPCAPLPRGEIYFSVSATPDGTQAVAAGQSATFTLTGWSTAPLPDWQLGAIAGLSTFEPDLAVTAQTINNGGTVMLIVTVPAGTPSSSFASVNITSVNEMTGGGGGNNWPIAVYVP
jgi:hypothetical protein